MVDEYDNMSDSGDLSTKSIRPAAATRFPVTMIINLILNCYLDIMDFLYGRNNVSIDFCTCKLSTAFMCYPCVI